MGPSFANHGKHVEENIEKQFKKVAKSKQKNANKRCDNQKKKKGKEQEPEQEQESEIKLPEFSLQLTLEEIAQDPFAMTGRIPTKKPKKRRRNAQRLVNVMDTHVFNTLILLLLLGIISNIHI